MVSNQINQVAVIRVPLTTKFRGLDFREMLIFKGSERWSEFSPFLEYGDLEASAWLKAALEYANRPLPKLLRTEIPINATLPEVEITAIRTVLERFGQFQTVKIKVAGLTSDTSSDLARVTEVFRLYPEAKIRLDANGALSVDQAFAMCQALSQMPIEYFEQPVATIDELAELKARLSQHGIDIKLAADESIRKAADPLQVSLKQAADVALLKVQPLGGITNCLEIANRINLQPVISSALESSVGIANGLVLAGALPELDLDCGLGTASLLATDIVRNPLIPRDGMLPVQEPEIDQAKLSELAGDSARQDYWHRRLDRCLELL